MKKFFNTTGPCYPERHYMVDPLKRLKGVEALIDQGQYFVIHAPRQSGKTTFGLALMDKLNALGHYTVLISSIQPAAQGRDPVQAMRIAALCIDRDSRLYLPSTEWAPAVQLDQPLPEDGLRGYLQQWALANPKPIVLLLDEVDALQDDNFLALLYQLRTGFTGRNRGGFMHSVGLIGLRDVRDYKIRLRPDALSLGTSSPFNLDSSVEPVRVGRWRRVWVGATTQRAPARKEEQRPQARCQWLNRAGSALTQKVNPIEAEKVNFHRRLQKQTSGQLRNLGVRSGFDRFKAEKKTRELTDIANRHALDVSALQAFVDEILRRRIFDCERLSELMAPLNLGWKARTQKELALMEELTPLLHKLAQGREIAGLAAHEEGR